MRLCSVPGCNREHYARSFCRSHYLLFREYGSPTRKNMVNKGMCAATGCLKEAHTKGFCRYHYSFFLRYGDPLFRKREHKHGEGTVCPTTGYRKISINHRRKGEHVLVMEKILNREINGNKEIVHHINGNKLDNRPENLVLLTAKEHIAAHRELGAQIGRLPLYYEINGERKTIKAWAEYLMVSTGTIRNRIKDGLPLNLKLRRGRPPKK